MPDDDKGNDRGDGNGDARWLKRDTDRSFPGNAKHRRVWPYAIGLPVALLLLWLGVVLYQRITGTDSRDPLTLNAKARDVLVVQPQPEGWARGPIVSKCPGEPEGCVGGGFLKVGFVETVWTAPAAKRGTERADAVDDACRELSAHLAARSGAPALDTTTCTRAVLDGRSDGYVLGWSEPRGEWAVMAAPSTGDSARTVAFTVSFRPDIPGD